MFRLAERQHPVDLVVKDVERLLAGARPAIVLGNHHFADPPQRRCLQDRPGRIEGRVEREEPRRPQMRLEQLRGGQEAVFRIGRESDPLRSDEMAVVVVVPTRHRIDDDVARAHQRRVRREDERSRPAGDQHRFERHLEREGAVIELPHRLAQPQDAVRRWIVRLPGGELAGRLLAACRGSGTHGRKVPDGEIADLLAARLRHPDLGGDAGSRTRPGRAPSCTGRPADRRAGRAPACPWLGP